MNALTAEKFLTDEERIALVALLNRHRGERDSIMLRLSLFTGARGCEVVRLMPGHFSNNAVTVTGAKRSNSRTIPLEPHFFKEILDYIARNDIAPTERVFPISTRHYRRIWDQYRINKTKGLHSLRHTAAIMLYLNTLDIHAVKAYTGHKDLKSLGIYLDYAEGQRTLRAKMRGMWKNRIDGGA